MLGNRLKRSAIVLALFAVLMMAFFAMAKEVHADEGQTMHVKVTANYEDAVTRLKWYAYKADNGGKWDEETDPTGEGTTMDLNWECPYDWPGVQVYYDYDSEKYELLYAEYNGINTVEEWELNGSNYGSDTAAHELSYQVIYRPATIPNRYEDRRQYNGALLIMPSNYEVVRDVPLNNEFNLVFKKLVSDEDKAAAKAFNDAADALPDAIDVKLTDKDNIEAVRAKYNALSDDALDLVEAGSLKKLETAEKILALLEELEEAKADLEQAKSDAQDAAIQAETDKEKAVDAAVKAAKEEAAEQAEKDKKEAVDAAVKAAKEEAAEQAEKDKKEAVDAAVKATKEAAAEQAEKDTAAKMAEAEAKIKAAEEKVAAAEEALKEAVEKAAASDEAKVKAEADKAAAEKALSEAQDNAFTVLDKVTLGKVKGAKKKLTVKWKAVVDAKGYEIIIAKNKKGTKDARTYTVKKGTAVKKTIKKLAKGKYFVKVRAYKEFDGNTVYGAFSKAKKVKVK